MNVDKPPPVRIAKLLRVVKNASTGIGARLEIDGEWFEFATLDGFAVHPARNQMPGVTLTIAAWRVELVDDVSPTTVGTDGTEAKP